MEILYRISDAGNPKPKAAFASKQACFENAVSVFVGHSFHIFADRCHPHTLVWLKASGFQVHETELGNAASWRHAARYALDRLPKSAALYFLEDDYWHMPLSAKALQDGLQRADYVSLYDHPDKYRPEENPFVSDGAEPTQLWLGQHNHWKATNSTTMTFACLASTLAEDWESWERFTCGPSPHDFEAFLHLQGIGSWQNRIFGKKRRLISAVPALATHTESAYLSPLRLWPEDGKV